MNSLRAALRLTTEYRDYVWGGERLRPGHTPTAEAWIVHEDDRIADGALKDRTLGEVAAEYSEALLGRRPVAHTSRRFPLLIKLLDCSAWLSLQVHPNNEQAVRLEGAGQFGKTEAWHVIDAAPGTELLCGLQPGTTREALAQAIRDGNLLDRMQRLKVKTGDSVFIRPGTIHALGPGLLIYEVQQTSNITYRVFDWNRPASEGRALHIEQSLAVADPTATSSIIPLPSLADGQAQRLITCDYFALDVLASQTKPIALDTRGESFHAITVLEGQAQITGGDWDVTLHRFETALVPADCGAYQLQPLTAFRALKSSVEQFTLADAFA